MPSAAMLDPASRAPVAGRGGCRLLRERFSRSLTPSGILLRQSRLPAYSRSPAAWRAPAVAQEPQSRQAHVPTSLCASIAWVFEFVLLRVRNPLSERTLFAWFSAQKRAICGEIA